MDEEEIPKIKFYKSKNPKTAPNKKKKVTESDILGVYMDYLKSDEIQEIQLDESSVFHLYNISKAFNDQSLTSQIEDYMNKNISLSNLTIIIA